MEGYDQYRCGGGSAVIGNPGACDLHEGGVAVSLCQILEYLL